MSSSGPKSDEIPKLQADFIAAGTYGCVVKPALPNVNVTSNDKSWKYYNTNVTKLYRDKDTLTKAIKNAKRIHEITDNDGHVVHPYKFEGYKGKNLKFTTLRACKLISDKSLNPLRMPNLGYSIHDIKRRGAELAALRKIPASIIFKQILKCFKQVETFHTKGYIHGDIRTSNIMVDPKTGIITIIDFDWFNPTDEFFKKYRDSLGYYNNPPECLLESVYDTLKSGESIETLINEAVDKIMSGELYKNDLAENSSELYILNDKNIDNDPSIRMMEFMYNFEQYINMTKTMHDYRVQANFKVSEDDLTRALLNSAKFIENKRKGTKQSYSDFYKMVEPTFDSYGLCFSMLELIYVMYSSVFFPKTKEAVEKFAEVTSTTEPVAELVFDTLQKLIKDVLVPCSSLTLRDRLPIEPAYKKTRDIFEAFESQLGKLSADTAANDKARSRSRSRSVSRSRAQSPGFSSPRHTIKAKRSPTGGASRRSSTRRQA